MIIAPAFCFGFLSTLSIMGFGGGVSAADISLACGTEVLVTSGLASPIFHLSSKGDSSIRPTAKLFDTIYAVGVNRDDTKKIGAEGLDLDEGIPQV